ncbi:CAP domain-containing protein [Geodermatophilus sp. CPCC 205506]|uniref:CAP domain-containing protein n=1 Tax=Geodermatophilus sp. CPCC 205506 TaxID=2936596 RepID=UPI003EEDC98B
MPAGSPLSSRLSRWISALWRGIGLRRLVPVLVVAGAVATIALAGPVVAQVVTGSTESPAVALDSSSSSAGATAARTSSSSAGSSGAATGAPTGGPVQMGVDGAPATETPVAPPADASTPPAAETTAAADEPSSEPAAEPDSPEPAGQSTPSSSAAEDDPEPAPAPAPAPRAAAPAAAAAPADPSTEGQVLALVNQERAAAGCSALVPDGALASVARAHSADMRDRDFFSHTNPEGLSPFDRAENAGITYSRAENIAYGQPDAAAVMDAWMNSSGHRANILDCGLRTLGVGVAEGPGGPWWTQLFGS